MQVLRRQHLEKCCCKLYILSFKFFYEEKAINSIHLCCADPRKDHFKLIPESPLALFGIPTVTGRRNCSQHTVCRAIRLGLGPRTVSHKPTGLQPLLIQQCLLMHGGVTENPCHRIMTTEQAVCGCNRFSPASSIEYKVKKHLLQLLLFTVNYCI